MSRESITGRTDYSRHFRKEPCSLLQCLSLGSFAAPIVNEKMNSTTMSFYADRWESQLAMATKKQCDAAEKRTIKGRDAYVIPSQASFNFCTTALPTFFSPSHIHLMSRPPTYDSRSKLQPHEEWWRDHYDWLKSKGYELRPRYRPGWTPSWKVTGRRRSRLSSEDHVHTLVS